MDTAFVLLKTEPARERDVYAALADIGSVVETHVLYGEYDMLARVECEDAKTLTNLLMQTLRMIDGVKETETLVAVDY